MPPSPSTDRHIPEEYLRKWQETADVMARIFEVPAGLIMRLLPEKIEVLVASRSEGNPYRAGGREPLNGELYCEAVIKSRTLLHVPNALDDAAWKDNPDVALSMISYLGVPLLWPDGTVFGTICVLDRKTRHYPDTYQDLLWQLKKIIEADCRLICQQQHLEEEVASRTASLRIKDHAIASSIIAIAFADLNGSLTYVNPAFLTLWGFADKGEVLGKPATDFWHTPLEAYEVIEFLHRDDGWVGEMTAKRKDGAEIDLQVSAGLVRGDDGSPLCMMASFLDISFRKKLEQQLQQAQKMEAIGTFAGGIAHDFNNILTAILGYGELLANDVPATGPGRQKLAEILKAAGRARDVVQQLLSFSRQHEEQKLPLEIQPIIKEALKLLRFFMPATIAIHEEIDRRCGAVVASPTQIYQLIMNLGTNAYHAMETGGELRVTLAESVPPPAALGANGSDRYLRLTVNDTGHGMDEDTRQRIFDPYFTTKKSGEGTGLGLAVVQGIVRELKGHVEVSSTPGRGTTFEVYLPFGKIAAAPRPPEPETRSGGTERILLVDDEESIVTMMGLILSELGYRPTTVTSSVEALELFERRPEAFDLVITDITIPQLGGIELARRIRSARAELPVIFITGFAQNIAEAAAGLGRYEVIQKPVLKKNFARTIRTMLDGA